PHRVLLGTVSIGPTYGPRRKPLSAPPPAARPPPDTARTTRVSREFSVSLPVTDSTRAAGPVPRGQSAADVARVTAPPPQCRGHVAPELEAVGAIDEHRRFG